MERKRNLLAGTTIILLSGIAGYTMSYLFSIGTMRWGVGFTITGLSMIILLAILKIDDYRAKYLFFGSVAGGILGIGLFGIYVLYANSFPMVGGGEVAIFRMIMFIIYGTVATTFGGLLGLLISTDWVQSRLPSWLSTPKTAYKESLRAQEFLGS